MERRDVGVDREPQPVDVERRLLVDELIGGRLERPVAQVAAVQLGEAPGLQRQPDRAGAMSRGRRALDEERAKTRCRTLNRAELGMEPVEETARRGRHR